MFEITWFDIISLTFFALIFAMASAVLGLIQYHSRPHYRKRRKGFGRVIDPGLAAAQKRSSPRGRKQQRAK